MSRPTRYRLAFALLFIGLATSLDAASLFNSIYRFRTLRTPHFAIHFHQGEDRLAQRLATIAEEAWRSLDRSPGRELPALTHVVIVDQSDLFNGYATLFPRTTIVISAASPAGSDLLKTRDWIRLVFTHELAHIVHLDRSASWARAIRTVFGRVPLAFPNQFLPTWQIEGLATYEESRGDEGRLHAGDFMAILGEGARAQRLDSIDRVNGGLVDWPGGHAPYAYGLGFHAFLADTYGPEKLDTLAQDTARRLPYTGSLAFGHVFGRSLGDLWRDYEQSLLSANPPAATSDAERLTRHGYVVAGPRFASPRCQTCPAEILYSTRNPNAFPALQRLQLDGSLPEQLTTRVLGATTGPGAETIYFDQEERRRVAGRYFDLYALDRASRRVIRLTRDERLQDPDVSPDGRTLVAVQSEAGQRNLVTVEANPGVVGTARRVTPIASQPDTQFSAPRWSPDGRSIVAERHRSGSLPEIVVVEAATGSIRTIASAADARWATPTWRPDGRAVVAAADFEEGPFNLYEIDLEGSRVRRLTFTTGGASWPDVSPDGKTIVYVGYTADGFDLFRVPYRLPAPGDVVRSALSGDSAPVGATTPPEADSGQSREYASWATLAPTSWWPVIEWTSSELRAGATTSGSDVLGYHAYWLSGTWVLSRPDGALPRLGNSPDWRAFYAYARWQPTFYVEASRETSFFAGPPDAGAPSLSMRRRRQVEAGIVLPVASARVAQQARASFVWAADEVVFPDRTLQINRSAARLAWSVSTAQVYGRSISPERGVRIGVTGELVRPEFGSSGQANLATADVRAYLPGLGRQHVLAIRASGGVSNGDRNLRQTFLLGGPDSNADAATFSSSAFSLLRAFGVNTFAGDRVALLNADYRWPIADVERGLGTWPLFVRTLSATLGADAGHAWEGSLNLRNFKSSLAGELTTDIVVGYRLPLTVTAGVAWGRDGSTGSVNYGAAYLRVGRAF